MNILKILSYRFIVVNQNSLDKRFSNIIIHNRLGFSFKIKPILWRHNEIPPRLASGTVWVNKPIRQIRQISHTWDNLNKITIDKQIKTVLLTRFGRWIYVEGVEMNNSFQRGLSRSFCLLVLVIIIGPIFKELFHLKGQTYTP